MEGGIRQPDHPMTKECRVGTQLHGQGVKRSFDDSKQFSRLFTSRVQGISIASLYFVEVFSGTAGLTAEMCAALDASAAQASVRMSQSRSRHLLNVLTFQTRQGKHFCGAF